MSIRDQVFVTFGFLLLVLGSCRQPELYSNADVARFCKLKRGKHLSYGNLEDALYNTAVSTPFSDGSSDSLTLRVMGDDAISGLDTCWVDIEYDPVTQRITDCRHSCQ